MRWLGTITTKREARYLLGIFLDFGGNIFIYSMSYFDLSLELPTRLPASLGCSVSHHSTGLYGPAHSMVTSVSTATGMALWSFSQALTWQWQRRLLLPPLKITIVGPHISSFHSTSFHYNTDEGGKQFLAGDTVYVEFVCSSHVCMNFFLVLQFPPISQRCAC